MQFAKIKPVLFNIFYSVYTEISNEELYSTLFEYDYKSKNIEYGL
ncbi:hypothetical protein CSCA_4349 [Clostridium scatologenes]|uniref:Uncharacterized protein n=1 Tax=Clostridium scatologenes TaxID=1548 RepID=A0A0E3K3V9_CLOSL|nr:hypothetical protein CSCA_4349 [Clostridium scatologenes]